MESHKKKLEQLKAKKLAILARERAAEKKMTRSSDTRKKILIGAFILNRLSTSEIASMEVDGATMSDYLTRDDDRALFGLSPLSTSAIYPDLNSANNTV